MALKDAMKKPGDTKKPPHLRAAPRPTSSCGTCVYWKQKGVGGKGACRLYGGYPTRSSQVCDSYKRG